MQERYAHLYYGLLEIRSIQTSGLIIEKDKFYILNYNGLEKPARIKGEDLLNKLKENEFKKIFGEIKGPIELKKTRARGVERLKWH